MLALAGGTGAAKTASPAGCSRGSHSVAPPLTVDSSQRFGSFNWPLWTSVARSNKVPSRRMRRVVLAAAAAHALQHAQRRHRSLIVASSSKRSVSDLIGNQHGGKYNFDGSYVEGAICRRRLRPAAQSNRAGGRGLGRADARARARCCVNRRHQGGVRRHRRRCDGRRPRGDERRNGLGGGRLRNRRPGRGRVARRRRRSDRDFAQESRATRPFPSRASRTRTAGRPPSSCSRIGRLAGLAFGR